MHNSTISNLKAKHDNKIKKYILDGKKGYVYMTEYEYLRKKNKRNQQKRMQREAYKKKLEKALSIQEEESKRNKIKEHFKKTGEILSL